MARERRRRPRKTAPGAANFAIMDLGVSRLSRKRSYRDRARVRRV
jgi:hypothetical protein